MRNMKRVGAAVLAGSMVVAGSAMAQTTGTDYSSILSGLDTSTAITAIVGAGVIVAGVGFAKWATKKVARFFG
ncbi:hypothetical protein [Rhodanobacter lindaniclasticus]|nr:hypothetical protein [Rhodanobacter lindaniclasticus]